MTDSADQPVPGAAGRRFGPEARARAELLYRAGRALAEIAAEIGASERTITAWMSERGVPPRTGSRARTARVR